MNDKYNKIVNNYEYFVKGMIIYNEFNNGFLFNTLTEDKIMLNINETYKNICNYGYEDSEFIEIMHKYLTKIIKLFNEFDVSYKLDEIKARYNLRKSFYDGFCFLAEGIALLKDTGNMLYNFFDRICEVDFRNLIKDDMIFMESCLFVQRLVKLFREIFFIHWKRIKIEKKRLLT